MPRGINAVVNCRRAFSEEQERERQSLATQLVDCRRYAAAHRQIRLAHVDVYPAPHGGLFQQVTRWLSAYGWLLFGLLAVAQHVTLRRRQELLPEAAAARSDLRRGWARRQRRQ